MAYCRVPPSTQAADIEAVPHAEAAMASHVTADVSPDASPPALLSVTAQKEVARRLAAVTGGSKGLGFWETKVQDFNRRRSSLKLPRSRSIVSEVNATERSVGRSISVLSSTFSSLFSCHTNQIIFVWFVSGSRKCSLALEVCPAL